jgi:hypothetical protein
VLVSQKTSFLFTAREVQLISHTLDVKGVEVMGGQLPSDFQESFTVSRRVLTGMIQIIDGIIAGAVEHPSAPPNLIKGFSKRPATKRVFPAMLQALGSSSNTLLRLSDEPGLQSRDCFSICRSIVELSVNVCYICAEGESAAIRAERHAQQKAVRDLDRKSSIGEQTIHLRFADIDTSNMPDELEKSINEFTSRSGREKGWINLSIDARCEKVGEVLGPKILTPLHWARFAVYRHSSEILHGTFFSAVFFMGLTDPKGPPKSLNKWIEQIASQHLMVLMATVLALVAVAKAVAATVSIPEIDSQAEQHIQDLRTAPFFSER